MFLDNLLPASLGIVGAPKAFLERLRHPEMVSYGLLASLSVMKKRGVICGIDSIWDVGANTGQFAFMAHTVWSELPVYSFEPDLKVFAQLEKNFKKFELQGQCFPYALGENAGNRDLYHCEDTVNTSLLEPDEVSKGLVAKKTQVECKTLDGMLDMITTSQSPLLKLDVQGYEAHVLRGADKFLSHCRYVLAEVTFTSQYKGGVHADELMCMMRERGFICTQIVDALRDKSSVRKDILEVDMLFENKNMVKPL